MEMLEAGYARSVEFQYLHHQVDGAPYAALGEMSQRVAEAVALRPDRPIHIHVAEQVAEVEEVEAAWGTRPMTWPLKPQGGSALVLDPCHPDGAVRDRGDGKKRRALSDHRISLGDGIFDGGRYRAAGGSFGVGSDSSIRIALSEVADVGFAMFGLPDGMW